MMCMERGGLEWAGDTFVYLAAERKELIPPRVPGDESSSSTSSAMETPCRIGVTEERRGVGGEGSRSGPTPGVGQAGGGEVVLMRGRGWMGHLRVAGVVGREGKDRGSTTKLSTRPSITLHWPQRGSAGETEWSNSDSSIAAISERDWRGRENAPEGTGTGE